MSIGVFPIKLHKRTLKNQEFQYSLVLTIPKQRKFPKHLLGETVEEAEAEFKKFSKMLNDLARSYAKRYGLERADIFGEAVFGLAEAKRDFDPKRSTDFKTFAIYKIRSVIDKYVREFVAPVTIPAYLRKINRWVNQLENVLRSALLSQDDINSILRGEREVFLSPDLHEDYIYLRNLIVAEAGRLNISQDALVSRAQAMPRGQVEVEEAYVNTDEQMYAKLLVEKLRSHMTEVELAISNMIMEGKTFEEVGQCFGHKAPWVVQKLRKMRKRLKRFKDGRD